MASGSTFMRRCLHGLDPLRRGSKELRIFDMTKESWSTLGFAGAGTVALAVLATNKKQTFCDGALPQRVMTTQDGDWSTNPALCSDASALWQRAWNSDWDGRAPPPGVEMKVKGKVRHLLFIRHGQYDLESDGHSLTQLGKEQSLLLGKRLAAEALGVRKDRYGEIKVKYAGIWSSDVTRAKETAQILSSVLEGVPLMDPDPLLAEGKPTVQHPISKGVRIKDADIWEESARMEAGFRKYVHRDVDHKRLHQKMEKQAKKDQKKRALPTEKALGDGYVPEAPTAKNTDPDETKEEPEHIYEIYVCHMNLIRYFVMRALQLPPEAWLRLRGDNTGITEIVVQPSGKVSLYRFADVGHLPIEMMTFH
eukprot:TRINITY_DN90641_c0_g1_i1.p1 TRINITY_DN90641_c0_g1~~TRINITY_DN90641_c0_g1_i1.p1  ORF type:complete len:365 (+),score=82.62 TRINITY_DN90641_c0_g1_i1:27-1121(+)